MANIEDCPGFETFGADVKAARNAKHLSRRALAEIIDIDSRYLANIENEDTIPALPVIIQLIKVCGLPVERYFNPEVMREESAQRQRISHKLKLCPEQYLTVIEGALDRALKTENQQMKRRVCEHPLFSFLQGGSAALFFLKNPGFCGQTKVFPALYLRGEERRASTASVATLANFCFRDPLAPKHKIACWDTPKPLCRKDGVALW